MTTSRRFDTSWDLVCHIVPELVQRGLRFPDLDLWASKDDELTVMFNAPGSERTTFLQVALPPACDTHSLAAGRAVVEALVKAHGADTRLHVEGATKTIDT